MLFLQRQLPHLHPQKTRLTLFSVFIITMFGSQPLNQMTPVLVFYFYITDLTEVTPAVFMLFVMDSNEFKEALIGQVSLSSGLLSHLHLLFRKWSTAWLCTPSLKRSKYICTPKSLWAPTQQHRTLAPPAGWSMKLYIFD